MTYQYRVLQRRDRWVMGNPYDEWFRPVSWDFDDSQGALKCLQQFRKTMPMAEFKMQRRPRVQQWTDLKY